MSETAVDIPSRLRARLAQSRAIIEAMSRFGRGDERLAWRAGTQEIAHLHSAEIIDKERNKERELLEHLIASFAFAYLYLVVHVDQL